MTKKEEITMKRFNITINEKLDDRMMAVADELGLSRSAMIRICIHDYLKQLDVIEMTNQLRRMEDLTVADIKQLGEQFKNE